MSCSKRRVLSGFTLIQILIVLVIIGIVFSSVQLSLQSDHRTNELKQEADRLHTLLRFAADEAILSNIEYGWIYYIENQQTVYQFVQYDDDEKVWINAREKRLEKYKLPDEFNILIELEGEEIILPDQANSGQIIPLILLLSSGEMTPFSLYLALGKQAPHFHITTDGLARISLNSLSLDE